MNPKFLKHEFLRSLREHIDRLNNLAEMAVDSLGEDPKSIEIKNTFAELALQQAKQAQKDLEEVKKVSLIHLIHQEPNPE